MRKVKYSERKKNEKTNAWHLVEAEDTADFHCFSLDFEEFDNGAVNFAIAVIELSDGTVKNIPSENIRFIDEKP